MLNRYKEVSVTPAGRGRFILLTSRCFLNERGLIHYRNWWVNTKLTAAVDVRRRSSPRSGHLLQSRYADA